MLFGQRYFSAKCQNALPQKGIKPTNACKESGVGGSFLSDINRGRIPSVASVQTLAMYLDVTTSELPGELSNNQQTIETPIVSSSDDSEKELLVLYGQLNQEGQEKLLDYADDLAASGKYKKSNPSEMGNEDLA